MSKKIFFWGIFGFLSFIYQFASPHNSYAVTNETDISIPEEASTLSPEDLQGIFNRLYAEGFQLGEEDGYNENGYQSLNNSLFSTHTSKESEWIKLGYTIGYEKGKRKKQEEALTVNEKENNSGEQDGYKQGLEDYKNATVAYSPPQTPAKSKKWNEGFSIGYNKAIDIMNLSVKAKKEGQIQGREQETLNIPALYAADENTRKAYEEGFRNGQQEQIKKEKKQYEQEGYKQGYAFQNLSVPTDLSPELATFYEKGFTKGNKQRHKDVEQEGFNAAFTYITYHSPSAYRTNTRLLESYKEGFQSNKVAKQLRKDAYEEGWKLGRTPNIPSKFKHNKSAIQMYKKYYELGQKKLKQTVMEISLGILIIVGFVGTYITITRRKTKGNLVSDDNQEELALYEKLS
ncbi:hypothetical protein [Priestia megaterium]|uniref:hypothetical protein n=1 Tax=Priestia megaterium TaxID=1404 RepID=UPI001127ED91|nr:hypothetical protein [Priestia megaterium]TPF14072.1 hypothetical protein CBE78_27275 [Priestia megaterium]TPF19471.1 hypothetical protein CBE79_26950 [Priestia megaterium]